jgi:hypothetical protein
MGQVLATKEGRQPLRPVSGAGKDAGPARPRLCLAHEQAQHEVTAARQDFGPPPWAQKLEETDEGSCEALHGGAFSFWWRHHRRMDNSSEGRTLPSLLLSAGDITKTGN